MSGNDFIILPNGKRIYIKDEYGTVENTEFPKRSRFQSVFWQFDRNINHKLTSSEIGLIFNSLKECASLDGNNELSDDELLLFMKNNIKNEELREKLQPSDMLKFLDILQKKSDEALSKMSSEQVRVENTIDKMFPELAFLNLGADNDVNIEDLTFENIQKHYSDDKYAIQENIAIKYKLESSGYTYYLENKPDESVEYTEVEQIEKTIINRETGAIVVKYKLKDMGASIEILNETTNDTIFVNTYDENSLDIQRNYHDSWLQVDNKMVMDASDNGVIYYFDEGILERVEEINTAHKSEKSATDEVQEIQEVKPDYKPVFNELINIIN